MRKALILLVPVAALFLSACSEEKAEAPPPVPLTEQALSHYCQMWVSEHGGPKAQIHLEGMPNPLFFAQVRDAVAYLRSSEREAPVTAVYVSNMSVAKSWDEPGMSNWIDAGSAKFVIGSDAKGGMGAPEVVPFADETDASNFVAKRGGKVATLDEIPDDTVLGAVEFDLPGETTR
ncbi:nitrous oxide reductase accessory protein NosL [Hoeflea prorocentri]|uniref:Nitrous oxide reductase accessory protein NosL n=1 Tax=Hoeflea prorocentri TaxID=1922333 RepID=A0A9X3UJX6_9HYPH|nr:nitrous oxide reductase accessory protein NosL [Hoeflea prorocentri]MCY6380181.1 nitrous oxide reductase accessory protein NosL [Hoeflea prorocentri]MDA5397981.1 nitrous oxide reductase accessory protein NosL [Hoeflea prorocentri]